MAAASRGRGGLTHIAGAPQVAAVGEQDLVGQGGDERHKPGNLGLRTDGQSYRRGVIKRMPGETERLYSLAALTDESDCGWFGDEGSSSLGGFRGRM